MLACGTGVHGLRFCLAAAMGGCRATAAVAAVIVVALGIVCAPPPGLTLETSVLTAVLNLHLGEQMGL